MKLLCTVLSLANEQTKITSIRCLFMLISSGVIKKIVNSHQQIYEMMHVYENIQFSCLSCSRIKFLFLHLS